MLKRFAKILARTDLSNQEKLSISANMATDDHWQTISGRKHDRSWSEIQELYTDALTAWRKNPMAWRIITTTVNYVIGKGMTFSSSDPGLDVFIKRFWLHRKNHMDLRLVSMCSRLLSCGQPGQAMEQELMTVIAPCWVAVHPRLE